MAQEATTIARPYAEAVFALANADGTLDQWSEMMPPNAGNNSHIFMENDNFCKKVITFFVSPELFSHG